MLMLVILCVFPKDEVGSFSGSFITFKINVKIFSNYNFSFLFCFTALVLFQNFLFTYIGSPCLSSVAITFSQIFFIFNVFILCIFHSSLCSYLSFLLLHHIYLLLCPSSVSFLKWFFFPFISVVFWMLSSLWLVIIVQAFWVILHVIMWIQKPQCHCHHVLRIL